MDNRPKVGVGVLIFKDNKILLGKRKGSHDSESWSPPGGHLEFMESLEKCAVREVKEETGVQVKNPKFFALTNDIFERDEKHYITIFMIAELDAGDPKIIEPDKCEKWDWFSLNSLPSPLMIPMRNLLKQNNLPIKY